MGKTEEREIRKRQRALAELDRIASYLSEEDRVKLRNGSGFVKVPSEELKRLRIDVYPYLM